MSLPERVAARHLRAADEIDLRDLPATYQSLIKKLPWEPERAWSGVHGYIVEFHVSGPQHGRFTKAVLKDLVSNADFRWIELTHPDTIAVGLV